MPALPPPVFTTFDKFIGLFCKAGDWFFTLVMVIAIVMIVVAAFFFLTGGGNPENIKKAKSILVWAIVGIIIGILPNAILAIISSFLGAGSVNPC
ncbi:MAG: hypothetical protein A3A80_03285 [Candidatus Terrybacteria bacterium RIFCSPLOWO2_01_FULL_44_24]|uniref:Uncharacterized protein n=1 Tax=Candidatus Terrybacteria bacterium RIFCSPHIGHO2_01_FULL_43_35 TaxID=1802361 RepID=A0A1G2PC91_9BACT|nr:MAG: hypothetical protein A2828_00815 [Candidatus Terrybacteria bacterium RIFCSPHIGHO2_01_FULL_43_35]OHA51153.1 MAG: hypothetical protein A3A80_03285 [Candidatus Terrybacteria bacterium RIFCSPLOWO2_01_FULL_44_24]